MSKQYTDNQKKEDAILLARLEDLLQQCQDQYRITAGDFLDAHQRKLAEDFCRRARGGTRVVFYGGYPEAERCMPVFLPDYVTEENLAAELAELIRIVRVHYAAPAAGGRRLTHRDYLGSLLALGLDREVTGDILVRDGGAEETGRTGEGDIKHTMKPGPAKTQIGATPSPGADIVVTAQIAEFIAANYDKAGRTNLQAEVLPAEELYIAPVRMETRHDTVASLRLDSVVAAAFRLSRAKAAEAIRRGLVSVNSAEALKVDAEATEGDRIVLRGQGKVILSEVGTTTRKDRIRITISAYR